jgi:hypothetical protein
VPIAQTGLRIKHILYRLESVTVHGTNVVNRAQQSFLPAKTRNVQITLLFYRASFTARDAFFGQPAGDRIKLTFPDGTVEYYPLDSSGKAAVASLPRGQYKVSVQGGGLPIGRPVALSSDAAVEVAVLSYLDIALVLGILVLLIVGLPLVRRPHLIRRPLAFVIRLVRRRDRGDPMAALHGEELP